MEHPCTYPNCDRVFRKPCKLQEHLRTHTGDRPFPCPHPDCPAQFKRRDHLQRHERTAHRLDARGEQVRAFACEECGVRFTTRQHLVRHQDRQHGEAVLPVSVTTGSSRTGATAGMGAVYVQGPEQEGKFRCPYCALVFRKKMHRKVHMDDRHPGLLLHPCPYCTIPNNATSDATSETTTPDTTTTHEVPLSFPTPLKLKHHLRVHHPEKHPELVEEFQQQLAKRRVECPSILCGEPECQALDAFPTELAYFQHLCHAHYQDVHPDDAQLHLEQHTSTTLRLALRRYREKRSRRLQQQCLQWQCPDCSKPFSSQQSLRVHRETVHACVRAFVCAQCGTGFTSKSSLVRHQKQVVDCHLSKEERVSKRRKTTTPTDQEFFQLFVGRPVQDSPTADPTTDSHSNTTTNTTIACPIPGCRFTFKRNYDLMRHLKSKRYHGDVQQTTTSTTSTTTTTNTMQWMEEDTSSFPHNVSSSLSSALSSKSPSPQSWSPLPPWMSMSMDSLLWNGASLPCSTTATTTTSATTTADSLLDQHQHDTVPPLPGTPPMMTHWMPLPSTAPLHAGKPVRISPDGKLVYDPSTGQLLPTTPGSS